MAEEKEVQLDDLSDEELDKQIEEMDNEETEEVETEDVDTETVETEEEETEESPEEDKRFSGKSKEDVEKSYFNLQRKLGEQANEIGELRKAQKELMEKLEKGEPEEEPYDPEKWADLVVTDPQAASDYYYEKYVVPKQSAQMAAQRQQEEQASLEARQKEITTKQIQAFDEFTKQEEFKDLSEEELGEYAKFLSTSSRPGKEGYYTVEDLKQRYYWFNPKAAKAAAGKEVLNAIEDDAPKVRTLSKAKTKTVKSENKFKDVSNILDAENIAEDMTDDELNKAIAEMD